MTYLRPLFAGTSGVPVGPEVAILNTHTLESLPPGTEGPICVRGEPIFRGYGVLANDPTGSRPDSFLKEGWFDTGDLGYLDADGFLYSTFLQFMLTALRYPMHLHFTYSRTFISYWAQ